MTRSQPGSRTPTGRPQTSLELVGNHHGLVVLAVARAEDEGDRAPTRPFGEGVECLRPIGVGELRPVARLELRPACRVVSEPRAQLRARAEVSRPGVEPELPLRPSARPDAVHQDAVAVVRGLSLIHISEPTDRTRSRMPSSA